MYQRGKLIVLTSNCHPSNLIAFNSNLKSRFEWGLVTNIQRPELNTAVEILRMKSHKKAVEIPDKVLQIIANEFSDASEIINHLKINCKTGDVVLIMSNGKFENIHQRLLEIL